MLLLKITYVSHLLNSKKLRKLKKLKTMLVYGCRQ